MGRKTTVQEASADPACCATALTTTLSEDRAAEVARGLAALADPVRLRLLGMIASAGSGEACGCELVEPLGRSQPTVSHHLKVLSDAGLVVGTRRGRWVWYRLVPERLEALRDALAPHHAHA